MTDKPAKTAVALRAGTVIESPAGDGYYVLARDIGCRDAVSALSLIPHGNVPIPKRGEMVPKFVQVRIAKAMRDAG